MTLPGTKKLVCVGSYRLTGRRLGRGNFAKVEEATHTILKTKVAIKVMNVTEIKEEYVVRNLHREAKLMSQLNHPCIAALYETMQSGSVYYLVTEMVPGGDLCSFIKAQRYGKLDEKTTKIFGRQLISAIAYMHGLGIVHRDLKMENIILNDSKTQVKIVDFGLSNMCNPGAKLHTHCGSPEYAAPELFVTGQLYGPQVDLWSLGVILYGMVIGQLPFLTSRDSRVSSQDRRKHLLTQINRGLASTHRKSLSPYTIEFRSMLARLLMPDPAKRIPVIELVRHPWLTERNRRPLRITGLLELDHCWRRLILKEIAKLMCTELSVIEYSVHNEPYGVIGGMYNILASRRMLQQDVSARVSLTQQRPTTSYTSASPHIKYDSLRPNTVCSANMRPQQDNWAADIQGTPSRLRVVGTRNINKSYNLRSSTVKKMSVHKQSKIAEPILTNRRTKSEPLHQPSQPSTRPSTGAPIHTADRAAKRRSEQQQLQQSQQRVTAKAAIPKPRSKSTRTSTNQKKPVKVPEVCTGGGGGGGGDDSKTRSCPKQTSQQPHQLPQRPATTPSDSSHGRATIATAWTKNKKLLNVNEQPVTNKKLLDEPIARCIAGYVGKYINSQGSKFKWIKDFAAFNNPARDVSN